MPVSSNQICMFVHELVSLDSGWRGLFFFLHTQLFFVVALSICLVIVVIGITSSYDILKLYKIFNVYSII